MFERNKKFQTNGREGILSERLCYFQISVYFYYRCEVESLPQLFPSAFSPGGFEAAQVFEAGMGAAVQILSLLLI